MKLNKPKNSNYCASVVEIKNLIPLDNCDNVCHTSIMGNLVVVSLDTAIGTKGLYFPSETQLSNEYLSANNLYRKLEMNSDPKKSGYFEENGRVRCVKFRGNKSEGLFMPLSSLNNLGKEIDLDLDLKINDEFDEILGIPICNKYVPKNSRTPGSGNSKKGKGKKQLISKLVDNQFRFHQDTSMFYKNLHKIKPESLISITYKMHGCVSANTIINTNIGDFTIQDIVENNMNVLIKAFDIENNKIVYVPIDDYYLLKDDGEWYEIELENGTKLEITSNNPIWLPELNCYRKVELLIEGDVLLVDEIN